MDNPAKKQENPVCTVPGIGAEVLSEEINAQITPFIRPGVVLQQEWTQIFDSSPDTVFQFVTDVSRASEYMPFVSKSWLDKATSTRKIQPYIGPMTIELELCVKFPVYCYTATPKPGKTFFLFFFLFPFFFCLFLFFPCPFLLFLFFIFFFFYFSRLFLSFFLLLFYSFSFLFFIFFF